MHDENLGLVEESELVDNLKNCDWKDKTVTLEIYESIDALIETYSIVSSFKRSNS